MDASKDFSIQGAKDFIALLKDGWEIIRADAGAQGVIYILVKQ